MTFPNFFLAFFCLLLSYLLFFHPLHPSSLCLTHFLSCLRCPFPLSSLCKNWNIFLLGHEGKSGGSKSQRYGPFISEALTDVMYIILMIHRHTQKGKGQDRDRTGIGQTQDRDKTAKGQGQDRHRTGTGREPG